MEKKPLEVQPDGMDRIKICTLLGRLSISLGCYQPNFEQFLHVFEPQKLRPDIQLLDIEKHFKYLQSTKSPLGKSLQQLRSELFTYLYGRLLKLETNEKMHSKHLIFWYKLFDADKPKKMTRNEMMNYQEAYIDRLTEIVQKLIKVNVIELQTTQMTKRINKLCDMHLKSAAHKCLNLKLMQLECGCLENSEKDQEQQEGKAIKGFVHIESYIQATSCRLQAFRHLTTRNLPDQVRRIGFAYVEHYAKVYGSKPVELKWEKAHKCVRYISQEKSITAFAHVENYVKYYSYVLKSFRWQQEHRIGTNLSDKRDTERKSSIEQIDMLGNNENCRGIVYALDCEMRQYILDAFPQVMATKSEEFSKMRSTDISEISYRTSGESEQQTEYSLVPNMDQDLQTEQIKECISAKVGNVKPIEELTQPSSSGKLVSGRNTYQHQRYIIAAPRIIIQLFRSNPSYLCSPCEPNAPNFFEQLTQFSELMGLAGQQCSLDADDIRSRVELIMRKIMYEPKWCPELCRKKISCTKLQQLLTSEEQQEYELLRWNHRDNGVDVELSTEDQQRDVLHGMLGVECLQLKPSALKSRLLLRFPHHQRSISESYLLLSLGRVGYFYKSLQQQQLRLCQLGDSGVVLARCLREELLVLYKFLQQRQIKPESLLLLYMHTRSLQLRFQWLLHLCQRLTRKTPLLNALHQELGQANVEYNQLLQEWLLKATQPLLGRIIKWLLKGYLPKSGHRDFFIVSHPSEADTLYYWTSYFKLIVELLPPFLGPGQAQLVLGVGRNQHFARKYFNFELDQAQKAEDVQPKLSDACLEMYKELNVLPLSNLLCQLHQKSSQLLLAKLWESTPTPLEVLTKLHQYLLLADVEFVRDLFEKLEPVLDQSTDCFNLQHINNMLEQLLGKHNEQLYVDRIEAEGKLCWSSFLLRWKLPAHWKALIGHRLEQYSSCFRGLWEFHHADYVLSERIRRQQTHFLERIGLHQSQDALIVGNRFDQFIDKLSKFISILRSYFLHDVLDSAFESLYSACRTTQSLDNLLEQHTDYLEHIEFHVVQTKFGLRPRQFLHDLYSIIYELDTEQQKFLTLSQLIRKANTSCNSKELHWSCLNTCDALEDLDKQFQLRLVNFLLALYATGCELLISLAKQLDHNRFYAKKFMELERVNTFGFLRKLVKNNL